MPFIEHSYLCMLTFIMSIKVRVCLCVLQSRPVCGLKSEKWIVREESGDSYCSLSLGKVSDAKSKSC